MPSGSSRPVQTASPSSALQSPTRERILAYLEQNRVASVLELSRAWGLTRADIRYHFNSLEVDGVIERAPRDPRLPSRRGRPVQQYRLAVGSTTGNLLPLCAALLDALLGALPVEERQLALRSLAARLAGSEEPAPGLAQRLNQASALLSLRGHQARWEARANGPHILLRTCPYAALLPTYPELCDLDRYLLERMVRVPLRQIARMDREASKPAACTFTIEPES
jgi:predicted ArsR family transcriptional regulator